MKKIVLLLIGFGNFLVGSSPKSVELSPTIEVGSWQKVLALERVAIDQALKDIHKNPVDEYGEWQNGLTQLVQNYVGDTFEQELMKSVEQKSYCDKSNRLVAIVRERDFLSKKADALEEKERQIRLSLVNIHREWIPQFTSLVQDYVGDTFEQESSKDQDCNRLPDYSHMSETISDWYDGMTSFKAKKKLLRYELERLEKEKFSFGFDVFKDLLKIRRSDITAVLASSIIYRNTIWCIDHDQSFTFSYNLRKGYSQLLTSQMYTKCETAYHDVNAGQVGLVSYIDKDALRSEVPKSTYATLAEQLKNDPLIKQVGVVSIENENGTKMITVLPLELGPGSYKKTTTYQCERVSGGIQIQEVEPENTIHYVRNEIAAVCERNGSLHLHFPRLPFQRVGRKDCDYQQSRCCRVQGSTIDWEDVFENQFGLSLISWDEKFHQVFFENSLILSEECDKGRVQNLIKRLTVLIDEDSCFARKKPEYRVNSFQGGVMAFEDGSGYQLFIKNIDNEKSDQIIEHGIPWGCRGNRTFCEHDAVSHLILGKEEGDTYAFEFYRTEMQAGRDEASPTFKPIGSVVVDGVLACAGLKFTSGPSNGIIAYGGGPNNVRFFDFTELCAKTDARRTVCSSSINSRMRALPLAHAVLQHGSFSDPLRRNVKKSSYLQELWDLGGSVAAQIK